jgi:sensor histidine kinase YesM
MIQRLAKTVAINGLVGMIVPVILWCLNPDLGARSLWRMLMFSMVLANSVGLLFGFLFAPLWRLTLKWPPLWAWSFRIFAIWALTTVGTLFGSVGLFAAEVTFTFTSFFWEVYRFTLVISFSVSGVITVYETLKARLEASNLQLRMKELERERAMKLAAEATLSSLESRIHPHFLFNTINSVSALIPEDPAKAERLLGRMSDLLRFSLDAPQSRLVPLAHEMKIVEDYLEIEKARFGDRLRYELQWAGVEGMVPPLSIQTLVENSVKYAIAPRREGGVVRVRVMPGLKVEVFDDGPGFDAGRMIVGHGLENLESRLRALFANHEGLSIRNEDGCSVGFMVPQGVGAS